MNEELEKCRLAFVTSIGEEIKSKIIKLMGDDFHLFIGELCSNIRKDQLKLVFGEEIMTLIESYNKHA